MTDEDLPWSARLLVRFANPTVASWVERALQPEASREVPRARAELRRDVERSLELTITARDSGAMRAALNTYLGWIHLALAAADAATRSDLP